MRHSRATRMVLNVVLLSYGSMRPVDGMGWTNIEHPTSDIQHRRYSRPFNTLRMFDVECAMFNV